MYAMYAIYRERMYVKGIRNANANPEVRVFHRYLPYFFPALTKAAMFSKGVLGVG